MTDGISSTEAVRHVSSTNFFEFQNGNNSISNLQDSNQSTGSQPVPDSNINGIKETNADLSLGNKIMLKVTEIDSDYKSVMGKLNDWPNFESYLEKRGFSIQEENIKTDVGITHITNIEDPKSKELGGETETYKNIVEDSIERMEAMQKKLHAFTSAGSEYSQNQLGWFISTEFWMAKVKILTSAVSQVSNGLRTLFTSQ